jgi:hypothetical protein
MIRHMGHPVSNSEHQRIRDFLFTSGQKLEQTKQLLEQTQQLLHKSWSGLPIKLREAKPLIAEPAIATDRE